MTRKTNLNRSSIMTETFRNVKLSHEDADRILQNILSACGMKPVSLAQAEAALKQHADDMPFSLPGDPANITEK